MVNRTTSISSSEFMDYFSRWTIRSAERSGIAKARRKRALNTVFSGMLSEVPRERFPSTVELKVKSVISTDEGKGTKAPTFKHSWIVPEGCLPDEATKIFAEYDKVYVSRKQRKRLGQPFVGRVGEEVERIWRGE